MKNLLGIFFLAIPFLCFSQEVIKKDSVVQESTELLVDNKPQITKDTIVQDTSHTKDTTDLEIRIEKAAEFPGGDVALYTFLYKKIVYPEKALDLGVQGKVFIGFVIEKDGRITNIKPVLSKEKQLGHGLEDEAMRVIKLMPRWTPAEQNGTKVRMRFTLPVFFKLK